VEALLVVGVPLCAALVAGVPLYFVSTRWLARLWSAAVVAQVLVVATAWLLLFASPDEQNWREGPGSTCPDLEGAWGDAVVAAGFGSIAVGAICLASATLNAVRGESGAGRVVVGLFASAAPFAIFIPLLVAALCGSG
jgi:hypothetical protein